jgi:hypothetical protein
VSKQAAQQRFVPKAGPAALDPSQGFSRFTDRARAVVVRAQEEVRQVAEFIPFDAHARRALELTFREALRLGSDRIGTGHVLLAVLEPRTAPACWRGSASTSRPSRPTSARRRAADRP